MKDNDVIKALECCGGTTCKGCPFQEKFGKDAPCSNLEKYALDLINRQKAEIKQKDTEIDILIRKKETLQDELAEKQAEIERLKSFRKEGFINLLGNCLVYSKNLKDYNDMRKGLKAEARKEFAERLKEKVGLPKDRILGTIVYADEIDNLLEEMESERE